MLLRRRRARPQVPDSLALLETVVTVVLRLVLGVVLLIVVVGVVDLIRTGSTEVSVAGINAPACVEVEAGDIGSVALDGGDELIDVRPDRATVVDRTWELCLRDAGWGQELAATGITLGPVALVVGSLLLIRRLARVAARRGLFTHPTAWAAAQLGLLLLTGALVGPFVVAALRGVVVSAAVPTVAWTDWLWRPDVPWTVALVGVGVLSFASVLGDGVPLQDEVDTTV